MVPGRAGQVEGVETAATHMMETVAGVITNIGRMIPYRRRNLSQTR